MLSNNGLQPNSDQLPPELTSRLAACALAGEQPVDWVETDLDRQLRFATGYVLLTSRRLLVFRPLNGASTNHDAVDFWPLESALRLEADEHAGLGILRLFSG